MASKRPQYGLKPSHQNRNHKRRVMTHHRCKVCHWTLCRCKKE